MKRLYLCIMLVGIFTCSLGFKKIFEEDKVNDLIKSRINDTVSVFNKKDVIDLAIEKNNIYKEYLLKLNNETNYNKLLKLKEEIELIEYKDIVGKLDITYNSLLKKYTAIETLNGNISAFTPYCSDGCHGYTASGLFIGNNIYYEDKDYGIVRIVAGDKSYPFGTIVRFNNLSYFDDDIYAIVLDRGGAVGKGRKVLFDLLFETEKEASNFGIARKIDCDILRLGY